MTEEAFKKANHLVRNLHSKQTTFNEIEIWKIEHEENNKDLSLSKIGHGWVSVPASAKEKILKLVYDIAKDEYEEARKQFESFEP